MNIENMTPKTAICVTVLVSVGALTVGFLLGMAIWGEFVRQKSDAGQILALLVLVNPSNESSPQTDSELLSDVYGDFFKHEVDIDARYYNNSEGYVDRVEQMLRELKPRQINAEQIEQIHATIIDKDLTLDDWILQSTLSDEGTEQDPEGESTVRRFNLMSLPETLLSPLMFRLGSEQSINTNMVVIEVLPELVRTAYVSTGHELVRFKVFKNMQELRHVLCPRSDPEDNKCKQQ